MLVLVAPATVIRYFHMNHNFPISERFVKLVNVA